MSTIRPEQTRLTLATTAANQMLYADAFEYAPHAMALLAPDGAIIQANRSLCRLLGYTGSELVGLNVRDVTHPDDLETDIGQRHQLASADIGRYELVQRYLRKNRTAVWVRLSVSSMRRTSSDPAYFVAQIENLAAQDYHDANATDAFLARFSDATSSAMHEIANCLTPLMLSVEMIVEQAPRGEVRELAQQIFNAARRVAFALRRLRLIQDSEPVAYMGQNRLLDLRIVEPPSKSDIDASSEAGAA